MTEKEKQVAALDHLILRKREQITREAEHLIDDLRLLVVRSGSDNGAVPSCPIQAQATFLNTLCGELHGLYDAKEILGA